MIIRNHRRSRSKAGWSAPGCGRRSNPSKRTQTDPHKASQRFDLTWVTMIDGPGKAFLAEAHANGVELIAR
jgi:hypothetical protein